MTNQQTDIEKTLKRILARELPEWPAIAQDYPLTQDYDGSLFVSCADLPEGERTIRTGIRVTVTDDIANDRCTVTRADWEAERAKILLESQPKRDPVIQEITTDVSVAYQLERGYEAEEVKRYEQELWDKVAFQTHEALFKTDDGLALGFDERAVFSFDEADAFMTERAKRIAARKAGV